MADLLGIGANTVETQQHHQDQKNWISRIYVTSLSVDIRPVTATA